MCHPLQMFLRTRCANVYVALQGSLSRIILGKSSAGSSCRLKRLFPETICKRFSDRVSSIAAPDGSARNMSCSFLTETVVCKAPWFSSSGILEVASASISRSVVTSVNCPFLISIRVFEYRRGMPAFHNAADCLQRFEQQIPVGYC